MRRSMRYGHAKGYVRLTLIENHRIRLRNDRQETLAVNAHPYHQYDQRESASPFARVQVGHVMGDLFGNLAEKYPLIQPEHVTRREDDAEGRENRPCEV